jgi:hypothetical protein
MRMHFCWRAVVKSTIPPLLLGVLLVPVASGADATRGANPASLDTENASGVARTVNVAGPVLDESNPFFLDLGANGRRCVTCHEPKDNLSVTPATIRARFAQTDGKDPIFRPNDGSNSPLADVSTSAARLRAYSMLLTKGVIRVGLPIPANAEFELVSVRDPYRYASSTELSLFRRPLPSTNLTFLSTVMWDGRETTRTGDSAAIHFDLSGQANNATTGHAGAPKPLDDATRDEIVAYELGLFTAQVFDRRAGGLTAARAAGGPEQLATQPFVFGGNDPLGCDAHGANCSGGNSKFDPVVFDEFDAWRGARGSDRDRARAAVARGEELFNTRPIAITKVSGINDDFKVPSVNGTCTTCHDTPHAGDHSVPAPLDIGVADPPVAGSLRNRFGLVVGDMPVYTLRNLSTGEQKVVTDPGRALITGKWKDIGRFKGPILRGLAGRGPYFHNGGAATLRDVVNFYDKRFEMKLSDQEKSDLEAFLRAL